MSAAASEVEYYPFPAKTSLPFSAAVRVGNLLFLSGQMGTNDRTEIVPGGIEAETRQTFANMKAILERHGSSLDRAVKCTVMLADMAEWPAMNAVYVKHFPNHLPARSAFGASALALGGRVEIECIATVDA
ncbi:MAG TPA: RidA family protein [Gemmatimonadaceae bacterium]|nr:RidA family protein [Gemmatimonadaceae bacterium]